MAIAKFVHKLSDWADKVSGVSIVVMLAGMVFITFAQIICRVFFTALSWSEEVARYLLVWSTFIGASCVYKRAGHINVTIVKSLFPEKMQKFLTILSHVLCGAFFMLAVYYGFKYMKLQGRQLSAALRIPMRFMYMAIPIGCVAMFTHVLDSLFSIFCGDKGGISK